MALLAQQTIAYKTYIKETMVKALREVFQSHPDPILAGTKITIDYSFKKLSYPAIVVRFYERSIKNAGVGHYEWLQTPEQIGDQETWFDNFKGTKSSLDYVEINGSYPSDGVIPSTEFYIIPFIPDNSPDAGTHTEIFWENDEQITIRSAVRTSYENTSGAAYGEVEFTATEMIVRVKFRPDDGMTITLSETSGDLPTSDSIYWLDVRYINNEISATVYDRDPLLDTAIPLRTTAAMVSEDQFIDLDGQGKISLEAVNTVAGTSSIKKFRANKLNTVLEPRYIKHKHYLYQGDIEFAVYALSSYDRDLISDSLVQTLAMADTEAYTDSFLQRIYEADPLTDPGSVNHYINLNTDEIQGFGESQAPAPWQPEDVLLYQTSYRIAIHGEFYSRTPDQDAYGLVEEIDTYPYLSPIEEKPDPNIEDPAPWV